MPGVFEAGFFAIEQDFGKIHVYSIQRHRIRILERLKPVPDITLKGPGFRVYLYLSISA
jgi:hypothetical protein